MLDFDTLIVNNREYSQKDIALLFEVLVPLGVRNFVFLRTFDLSADSVAIETDVMRNFKKSLDDISSRGIKSKVCFEMLFDVGASQNPNLPRLRVSRKRNAVFVSLPIFPNTDDNVFSYELNRLLYRSDVFPVFTCFDKIIQTAPWEFCEKLLQTRKAGFSFDLNAILCSKDRRLLNHIINSNTYIIPSISHNIGNYAGIDKQAQKFMENYGKSNYYRLCSQFRKCAERINL